MTAEYPNLRPPWKPGENGNKSGMPGRTKQLARLARTYTEEAFAVLLDIMRTGERDRDRAFCAVEILNRGHGKAPETVTDETDADAVPTPEEAAEAAARLRARRETLG